MNLRMLASDAMALISVEQPHHRLIEVLGDTHRRAEKLEEDKRILCEEWKISQLGKTCWLLTAQYSIGKRVSMLLSRSTTCIESLFRSYIHATR